MFERYTEKARRVIFFARYEASQYGSKEIQPEHLLLGLMREGHALMCQLLGTSVDQQQVRAEVDKVIIKGKPIPPSVEVPLSAESKKVLQFSVEEAETLGSRHVGLEHLLLGILRVEKARAARILRERGGNLAVVRDQVANSSVSLSVETEERKRDEAIGKLMGFLAKLESNEPIESAAAFAENAQVVDSKGKRWKSLGEIVEESAIIFNPYTKQGVTCQLESVDVGPANTLFASVLWNNVVLEGGYSPGMHRMTIILAFERQKWTIFCPPLRSHFEFDFRQRRLWAGVV